MGNAAQVTLMDYCGPRQLSKYEKNLSHTARLHQSLVSVPAWLLKKMNAPRKPAWLEKHFFEIGAIWEWDELTGYLSMSGVFTGHAYDSDRGLRRLKLGEEKRYVDSVVDDTDDFDAFDKKRMDW
jgi:hypothetical protein